MTAKPMSEAQASYIRSLATRTGTTLALDWDELDVKGAAMLIGGLRSREKEQARRGLQEAREALK